MITLSPTVDARIESYAYPSAGGPVLATLRKRTGLSAREAAQRAGVGRRYLQRVERGDANATSAWLGHVANILAEALVEKAGAAQ